MPDKPTRGEFWRFGRREWLLMFRLLAWMIFCEMIVFLLLPANGPKPFLNEILPHLFGIFGG